MKSLFVTCFCLILSLIATSQTRPASPKHHAFDTNLDKAITDSYQWMEGARQQAVASSVAETKQD